MISWRYEAALAVLTILTTLLLQRMKKKIDKVKKEEDKVPPYQP